ncbi:alpha/beta fold hydrolase [Paenibacillus sp. GCM10027627]|uniref:alpha/beta fold hydrolase n=1 Tax=unclassified Paenibacillus TaxID=185978 RepID=UPI00363C5520
MGYDTSNEKILRVNGVELATETFGNRNHPAILLIQGAGNSMISWDAEFCRKFADEGRFIIHYDSRDTGRSTSCEPGEPNYALRDLKADTLALIEAFELSKVHLFGQSQGAAITQLLAIEHPERIASITLGSGTPGGPGHGAADLPSMNEEIAQLFSGQTVVPEPDWNDRESVANFLVEGERPFAGGGHFDEEWMLETARHIYDRTLNLASQLTNPFLLDAGSPWRDRLAEIAVPALIIHGTADPLFPFAHGEALAREIQNAKLLPLHEVGHAQLPRHVWDSVVKNIVEHTSLY